MSGEHLVQLTDHFTLAEFVRSHKASKRGIDNSAPRAVRNNLRRLARRLEAIRQWACDHQALLISSSYRCFELNNLVGGTRQSYHLYGLAADLYSNHMEANELFLRIREAHQEGRLIGWDELIVEDDRWVHFGCAPPHSDPLMKTLVSSVVDGHRRYTVAPALPGQVAVAGVPTA